MKLIKIDPSNPPEYKRQMLFYNSDYKKFRLGEVDYVRTDDSGTRIIYKSLEPIFVTDGVKTIQVNFQPTHYLDLNLNELEHVS